MLNVWTGGVFFRQSKISQISLKYLWTCYRNLLLFLVKVSLVDQAARRTDTSIHLVQNSAK